MSILISVLPGLLAYPLYRVSMVQQVDDVTSGQNVLSSARDIYDNAKTRPLSHALLDLWEFTCGRGFRTAKSACAQRIAAQFTPHSPAQRIGCTVLATSVTHPFDVLLARSASDLTGHYGTALRSVLRTYQEDGLLTFYHGWGANIARTALTLLAGPVISSFAESLLAASGSGGGVAGGASGVVAGAGTAGAAVVVMENGQQQCATVESVALALAVLWVKVLLVHPLRVVQSRQMVNGQGFVESCKQVYERHGVMGFFRGYVALGMSSALGLVAGLYSLRGSLVNENLWLRAYARDTIVV